MYERGSNGFFGPLSDNTMGKPNALTDMIRVFIHFGVDHQVLFNVTIGVVQMLIGIGILWPRATKVALGASVLWGAGVWVIGEAIGGVIFPQASMLTGAPGAALIYCILAIVLWPDREDRHLSDNDPPSAAKRSLGSRSWLVDGRWAYVAWAAVWCSSALLELERSNWSPNSLSAQLSYEARGEPWPLAGLDRLAGHASRGIGIPLAGAMLAAELLVGWWVLRPATRHLALTTGIVISILYWIIGQNLGGILTGQATDPNLGPLMVIFALALLVLRGSGPAGTSAADSAHVAQLPDTADPSGSRSDHTPSTGAGQFSPLASKPG